METTLATVISEMRDMGLTQSQVGKELGISQAHVSNIQKGKRGNRTPATTLERALSARDRLRQQVVNR